MWWASWPASPGHPVEHGTDSTQLLLLFVRSRQVDHIEHRAGFGGRSQGNAVVVLFGFATVGSAFSDVEDRGARAPDPLVFQVGVATRKPRATHPACDLDGEAIAIELECRSRPASSTTTSSNPMHLHPWVNQVPSQRCVIYLSVLKNLSH